LARDNYGSVAGSIRQVGPYRPYSISESHLRLVDIMSFTNSYKADVSPLPSGDYGPDPYDINWMMPLYEATLESDRIKLTPFVPSLHARGYADQVKAHPDLHRWFPFDLSTLDAILKEIESFVRRYPMCILFAIIDKPAATRSQA